MTLETLVWMIGLQVATIFVGIMAGRSFKHRQLYYSHREIERLTKLVHEHHQISNVRLMHQFKAGDMCPICRRASLR